MCLGAWHTCQHSSDCCVPKVSSCRHLRPRLRMATDLKDAVEPCSWTCHVLGGSSGVARCTQDARNTAIRSVHIVKAVAIQQIWAQTWELCNASGQCVREP